MNTTTRSFILAIVAAVLLSIGLTNCGGGSSSGDSSSSSSSGSGSSSSSSGGAEPPSLSSACGSIVNDGELANPAPSENAFLATVTANRPDAVVATPLEGPEMGNPIVIILHGVEVAESSGFVFDNGVDTINSMTANGAYIVPAGDSCGTTLENGVQGVAGDVFDLSGQSLTEALIELGSLVPSPGDVCNGDALVGCFSNIEVNEPVSSQTFSRFLWKPVAERDGNLVVLTDAFGATIVVSGAISETLIDSGPSNGFGTTARGSRTGCSYGTSITVTLFDALGRRINRSNGDAAVVVPSGCDRFEF